jgi:hypothetical protein
MYFRWQKQDLISIAAKVSHYVSIVYCLMSTLEVLCYIFFGVMLFREQFVHCYVSFTGLLLKFILLEHKKCVPN